MRCSPERWWLRLQRIQQQLQPHAQAHMGRVPAENLIPVPSSMLCSSWYLRIMAIKGVDVGVAEGVADHFHSHLTSFRGSHLWNLTQMCLTKIWLRWVTRMCLTKIWRLPGCRWYQGASWPPRQLQPCRWLSVLVWPETDRGSFSCDWQNPSLVNKWYIHYLKGFHHGRAHPSGHVSTEEEEDENVIRHSVKVSSHAAFSNQSHKDWTILIHG